MKELLIGIRNLKNICASNKFSPKLWSQMLLKWIYYTLSVIYRWKEDISKCNNQSKNQNRMKKIRR